MSEQAQRFRALCKQSFLRPASVQMADAIFASLKGGLRFKRHQTGTTPASSKQSTSSSPKSASSTTHTKSVSVDYFAESDDDNKKSTNMMDTTSDSGSEQEFSKSRAKATKKKSKKAEESNSTDEESEEGALASEEEEIEQPNNFVMDRVIKVDGLDLPYEKLNKVAKEKLFEIGKHDVVTSRVSNFEQLGISDWLLRSIRTKLQWSIPTHIQQLSIPVLLAGRDLQVASPTGSGKTAAFLIPILQLLILQKQSKTATPSKKASSTPSKGTPSKTKAPEKAVEEDSSEATLRPAFPLNVVVAPTIELARQIYHQALLLCDCDEARSVSVQLLNKGEIEKLRNSVESTATVDLVVTTPARLIQMVESKAVDLSQVHHLVLDEVDRQMTDEMLGQADAIIAASKDSKSRRIAFFSATIMPSVETLATQVLESPIRARVGAKNIAADHVTQHLKYVGTEEGKLMALRQMLSSGGVRAPVLLFLQSKSRTGQLLEGLGATLTGGLSNLGFTVDYITGDRTEAQRKEALLNFRKGETTLLVTTDLLARGLDFKAVATVINYDMPTSPTTYIHRIGRTGRVGGVTGEAWTLFTDADLSFISGIANVMVRSGQKDHIPEWVLRHPKASTQHGGRKAVVPRENVGGNFTPASARPMKKKKFINPSRRAEKEIMKTKQEKSKGKHHKSEQANPKKRKVSRSDSTDGRPTKVSKTRE